MEQTKFQIGKSGVSDGVIESLKLAFKNHKQVRISVLKGAVRDKEKVKEMAQEISKNLSNDKQEFRCKIIGFTIIVRKLKRQ